MVFRSAYLAITVTVLYTCFVQGIPRFTRETKTVLYVSSGGTARLVWDYNIKNRSAVFDPYSPEWSFYNSSGGKAIVGFEDGYNGWKFVMYKNCPARLRGRVSKESTATLVISNVTTADSGIYGCDLVLLFGSPIRSKVQLIVTGRPRFTSTVNPTTAVILGSNLSIHCSATASPMPNVTWLRIMERPRLITTGVGEALLRFNNITISQSGTYECQATNNPNEDPVKMKITINAVKMPAEPTNVSVPDINITSALIKWVSPRDDGGAPIIGYKIQINPIPPREVFTKPTYYVIKNLTANTTYTVQVYARNLLLYGRAANTTFTTRGKGARATTTSKTVVSKQKDKRKGPTRQSIYFFQGITFSIIHLTITSVLLVMTGVLITCFYTKFKNNCCKVSDNRQEISRFAIPVLARTADEDSRAVVLTTIEKPKPNNDLAVNASNVLASKVYENISEDSFDPGNEEEVARTANLHFSQPRHVYQELNTNVLASNAQRYQTLNRTLEDNATKIQTDFPPPKYEPLNSANNAQGSEYQKLHLYASIGDKK